jgi:superfamily II DNA helicase RecQ
MMTKPSYLHVILPTAGGKATLFLIGASLATSKTTIIVSPLIALKIDLFQKATTFGLQPIIWDELCDTPSCRVRVLLVQIEHVTNPKFIGMVNELVSAGDVDRMIWDECHMIPLTKDYRTNMYRVYQALIASVPMVFSTATFPDCLRAEFEDFMSLWSVQPIPMVRATINLSNMSYHVISLPNIRSGDDLKPLQEVLVKVDSQVTSPSGTKPHVLVFMRSRAKIDEMITKLQGLGLGDQFARFHAQMIEAEKLSELDRFLSGKARILLATTALTAGIDFGHVDVVAYWGESSSFCDFIQGSGRSGRSPGQSGWSYCIVTDYDRRPRDQDSVEELEFKKYLNERVC